MNETTTTAPAQDRASIRSELATTQAAYHDLVAQITQAQWSARSGNPGWTCGQLVWHLASGVKFAAGLIENARKGKGTNPPSFLLPLAYKANEFIVRRSSRKATRQSVLSDYDSGQARLLTILDGLQDHEFALSATNFGEARTIAETFRMPVAHFAEHGPEIRNAPR